MGLLKEKKEESIRHDSIHPANLDIRTIHNLSSYFHVLYDFPMYALGIKITSRNLVERYSYAFRL